MARLLMPGDAPAGLVNERQRVGAGERIGTARQSQAVANVVRPASLVSPPTDGCAAGPGRRRPLFCGLFYSV